MSGVSQPSREDGWKAIKFLRKILPPKTESSPLTGQRSPGRTAWFGKSNKEKLEAWRIAGVRRRRLEITMFAMRRVQWCSAMGIVHLVSATTPASGQSALDGFDPNANGAVRAAIVQPDGKILLGGDFKTLSPNSGSVFIRNHIARLKPDGTLDPAFDPNANDAVLAITMQANGKILLGGKFTSVAGVTRNHIARLNMDGSLDLSFDPGANDVVSTLALEADGKIFVGGLFTNIDG